jgi:hypothetical protein
MMESLNPPRRNAKQAENLTRLLQTPKKMVRVIKAKTTKKRLPQGAREDAPVLEGSQTRYVL